jgi:hypothetical protein
MLTLAGGKACAITRSGDNGLFPASGGPDPAAVAGYPSGAGLFFLRQRA